MHCTASRRQSRRAVPLFVAIFIVSSILKTVSRAMLCFYCYSMSMSMSMSISLYSIYAMTNERFRAICGVKAKLKVLLRVGQLDEFCLDLIERFVIQKFIALN